MLFTAVPSSPIPFYLCSLALSFSFSFHREMSVSNPTNLSRGETISFLYVFVWCVCVVIIIARWMKSVRWGLKPLEPLRAQWKFQRVVSICYTTAIPSRNVCHTHVVVEDRTRKGHVGSAVEFRAYLYNSYSEWNNCSDTMWTTNCTYNHIKNRSI